VSTSLHPISPYYSRLTRPVQTDLLSSTPLPDNLHILATARDAETGLALSSRNAYLSEAERAVAPVLHRALRKAEDAWRSGATGAAMIEAANTVVAEEQARIASAGEDVRLEPDYFEVFARDSFAPVHTAPGEEKLVVAGALRVGKTRLIDNVLLGWEAGTPAAAEQA
jgi:pantoate--beta-alanine ligase